MRKAETLVAAMCHRQCILATLLILTCAVGGCSRKSSKVPPAKNPTTTNPPALAVPVEMKVAQRSTTVVPGSHDKLRITIDDVTRNQVMLSLATKDTVVLASRSISPGSTASFEMGDRQYVVELKKLDNALVGEDFATFVFSSGSTDNLSENEKIEQLIQSIADRKGAVFIRNGTEHTAQKAADHLRMKWRAKADEIESATEFIDKLASRSSLSGNPYRIRLADGTVLQADDYFRKRLHKIESSR